MANEEEMGGRLEWKIKMPNGKSKVINPERGITARIFRKLQSSVLGFFMKIQRFLVESWNIGVDEPKKFIHCVKVGLALTIVSLLYYMRPLYEGVGGNAMWAIMTVVVVFEYTVGATLCKCINRAIATIIGGSLGLGVYWIASNCGQKYEPLVLGASIFIFASVATFSRFIPSVKARFDYGAMIFILTFTYVSISGYRIDKLIMLAYRRISTIVIGTSLCIIISMLIRPVWAGEQLHDQIITNLEKLATSLEGYVAEYFSTGEIANITQEDLAKKLQGYKCVLNSKATEESMASFARWEPAHGHVYFGYPWKQYLKIGDVARYCAYCIDNLGNCINSEMQGVEFLRNHVKDKCTRLSLCSSEALKELAMAIKTRRRSSNIDFSVDDIKLAVEDLYDALKSLPCEIILPSPTIEHVADGNGDKIENRKEASMLEVISLGTLVSLLIEIAARIEEIVLEVDKLASMAEFKIELQNKSTENHPSEYLDTKSQDQEP